MERLGISEYEQCVVRREKGEKEAEKKHRYHEFPISKASDKTQEERKKKQKKF